MPIDIAIQAQCEPPNLLLSLTSHVAVDAFAAPKLFILNIYKVEDMIFHIPNHLLKQSQFFGEMIEGKHTGLELEGKDNEHPIALGGISAFEMTSFLDVTEARVLYSNSDLNFSQLTSALYLATMWGFDDIRDKIIEQVDKGISAVDPMHRIDASLKCRVEKWLHPAYAVLCRRETILLDAEAERLGLRRSMAICRVRESLRSISQPQPGPQPAAQSTAQPQGQWGGWGMPPPPPRAPSSITHLPDLNSSRTSNMPSKHSEFGKSSYLIFLVDDTLFHIPLRRLSQSQYFRDMIGEAYIGSEGEGKSDEHPICLGGISAFEMESFLKVIDSPFIYGDPQLAFSEWAAALHLATMWNFDEIRERVIAQMDKTISTANIFERIDVSLKCGVEKWLHPAYEALCTRTETLSDSEAEHLGLRRAAAIWRIRERLLVDKTSSAPSSKPIALRAGKGGFYYAEREEMIGEVDFPQPQPQPPPPSKALVMIKKEEALKFSL
ncbi:hypothetical protein FRC01_004001 [Tulasnella sp. 417]|nr:hypothetical protein FRC01_004001 [Tulasnella sp. 417]